MVVLCGVLKANFNVLNFKAINSYRQRCRGEKQSFSPSDRIHRCSERRCWGELDLRIRSSSERWSKSKERNQVPNLPKLRAWQLPSPSRSRWQEDWPWWELSPEMILIELNAKPRVKRTARYNQKVFILTVKMCEAKCRDQPVEKQALCFGSPKAVYL